MYHLVYLTTNLINNKIYVGVHSSSTLHDAYLGSGNTIKRAIKLYGKENFTRKILFQCLSKTDAYEIESAIVDKWFINQPYTYNTKTGGFGSLIYSEQSLQQMRNNSFRKGKPRSKENTEALRIANSKPCSEEKKMKLRAKHKGKKLSEEHRQKLSEAAKKRTRLPCSEETKQNISKAKKGKKYNISEETHAILVNNMKNTQQKRKQNKERESL